MYYTVKQIAGALGITVEAVRQRAKKGGWSYVRRIGRGGGKAYALGELPQSVQYALVQQAMQQAVQSEPGKECTAEQIAAIMGVTRKRIDTRARKERWKARKKGPVRVYAVNELPKDVQAMFDDLELVAPKDVRKRVRRLRQVVMAALNEIELLEGMIGA